MKLSPFLPLIVVLAIAPTAKPAAAQSDWPHLVPESSRTRTNPLLNDQDASATGAKLFKHDCASCHGAEAQGRGSRPALQTERVNHARDGELEWLLKNGSLAHGMPSWSSLPEVQRWQIVRYLRTLPLYTWSGMDVSKGIILGINSGSDALSITIVSFIAGASISTADFALSYLAPSTMSAQ